MVQCPSCSRELSPDSRFCSACGASADPSSEAPTQFSPQARAGDSARATSASHLSSSGGVQDGRFLPGTLLAERYRIIGLLGKGGMGEVYRADDLKLGQPVALKLLPEKLEADEGRLKRFLGEVRTARQVSHNNVCRVYDVGETDGYHFLSMEYVDGEDLATLLKRIGRLPKDKAIEIARQICAGLAAAHDAGVLHRDLKPANIMIDGRGRAKITDFGLAGIADEIRGPEIRAGTPAYMAPEQLAGKEVSVRSDLYSLGLVLYELFTGKPAFQASSAAELMQLQTETTPTSPSSFIEGFDPAVERVLLRCLDRQPARRPASALAVAAALPGGDPLAAALAAGETPSPEMVADAGEEGGLRPAVALGYLAFTVLGMGLVAILTGQASLLSLVPMDKPPQALVERARQIVDGLGYTEPPVDDAYGFGQDGEYLRHVKESDDSPSRWERMGARRPSAVRFWYRQSPRPLVPINISGQVSSDDPPFRISGMVNMMLSSQGNLMFFKAMPPHVDDSSAALEEPDWSTLFEEAGLDGADFDETPSTWNAENYCDQRIAWLGTYPDQEEPEIRVEACAYRGRVAFFDVIHPWDRPWRMQAFEPPAGQKAASIIVVIVNFILIVGACLLAHRNLQAGRGDRKSAFRLAIVVVTTIMLSWLLRASHVSNPGNEQGMFFQFLGIALVNGVLLWLTYIALEPFVRRRWPESMVSWTRLMSGRVRDPLVGSHILLGAAVGILFALLAVVGRLVPGWLGWAPPTPSTNPALHTLATARWAAAGLLDLVLPTIVIPMFTLFLLVLFRVLLRKQWLAIGVFVVLFSTVNALPADYFWIFLANWVVVHSMSVFVLFRYGIVAASSSVFFAILAGSNPLFLDLSLWYAGGPLFGLALAVGIVVYAFYTSLAGRRLLENVLAEA